jgi:hypothetical protein
MITPAQRAESAVVWFFSRDLGRAIWIQQRHVRADDGSCSGCCTQMSVTAWPCIILRLADECVRRQIPLQRQRGE